MCDAADPVFQVFVAKVKHVYEVILAYEVGKQNLEVARQVPIPSVYDGLEFEEGYRADLIVERSIIVELKSVEALLPVHWKQLCTQPKTKGLSPWSID